jgi:type II secretion system protein H
VEKALKRISRATNSKGFSLVEILIVLALVGLVSAITVPTLTSVFRASIDSFVRQTAVLLREARDRALLRDRLLRLRIDLDKQEFWLEEAPGNFLLAKPNVRSKSEKEEEKAKEKDQEAFRLVKELTKDKKSVPRGMKITEISSPRLSVPAKEGTVDIYFFSNGSADGATLTFTSDEGVVQRLMLHPVTGMSRLLQGKGDTP